MDPGTLTHNFARIARKADLAGTRFHDLRHTFATLMLMAGTHPKIVSEMLGHASVAFTLDIYNHVTPTMQQAAMKRLDEVLGPELAENQNVCNRPRPSFKKWSQRQDSNLRPAVYETAALPLSYAGIRYDFTLFPS